MGIALEQRRRQAAMRRPSSQALPPNKVWRKRMGIEPAHPVASHAAQTALKIGGIQLSATVHNG